MDEQAQGIDDETDGTRGVEAEGFVGDDAHLGHRGEEMARDDGYGGIVAHEDGDAALTDVLSQERGDNLRCLIQHGLFVVGRGQQSDVYKTSLLTLVGYELLDIGIGLLELFGLQRTEFLLGEILEIGDMTEEGIVEVDDATLGAVVGAEVARLDLLVGELTLDIVQESPVARAPTVDALLHVAHDEVGGVLVAHGFGEQHVEVAPLNSRSVLELIDHDMLYLGTYLLEDKGRVALADERVEQLLGVAEQEAVVHLVEGVHLLFDAAQESELVQMAQGEVGTLVEAPLAGALVDGIAQDIAQRTISETEDELALGMGLGHPLFGIAQTVGYGSVLDGGVEDALLEFEEEACDASILVGEVVGGELFALEGLEETLTNLLHALLGSIADITQTLGVVVEEAWLAHLLFEFSAHGLIVVAKDVAPEGLDL